MITYSSATTLWKNTLGLYFLHILNYLQENFKNFVFIMFCWNVYGKIIILLADFLEFIVSLHTIETSLRRLEIYFIYLTIWKGDIVKINKAS